MKTDLQKSKVYSWETENIAPYDTNTVPFCQIESIVKYIWHSEGLSNPPLVEKISKNCKKAGDATRTIVRFRETTYTWIILHELAHAMASLVTGETNCHGALFMGLYIKMVKRYLNLDVLESAIEKGLRVKEDAIPCFI